MGKKEKASAIVMTEGKREIIRQLLSEYDIQTAQDIQELFGSRQRGCSQAGSLCHSGNKMRRTQGSFEHRNRENENAKYWLGVLNSLKNRGLKDILILCADGLTGSLMPSRPTRKHRKFY